MRPIFISLLILIYCSIMAQKIMPLYEGKIPNSNGNKSVIETTNDIDISGKKYTFTKDITEPTLSIYLAEKPNGSAVIICPGGGYLGLAMDHEGHLIAQELNKHGISAFVLKSRSPLSTHFYNKEYVGLQDAQQAICIIRSNAKKWKLKANRLGILGSSAGGHLAATAATMYKKSYIENQNKIDLRPSFVILNYPVISMTDEITHKYSRWNLIGNPIGNENDVIDLDKIKKFSCELNVDANTPPAFVTHAIDDETVKIENSLRFIAAMQQHHRPVESFFYEKGGHGYGMDNITSETEWIDSAIKFISTIK